MAGWISLHRKFLEWEWFDDNNMVKLFIYLLLKANHSEATHQGVIIKRGQLKTGLHKLTNDTKITIQTLRTCLKRLEKTGEINMQVTNKYRIITICNYEHYQDIQQATNKQPNKQLTSNQQATNKQLTTNNNDNKNNNVKNEKELLFKTQIFDFKDSYHIDTLNAFFDYWSEWNKSKTKMRFEMQKTWDLNRRLKRWASNNFDSKSNGKQEQPIINKQMYDRIK